MKCVYSLLVSAIVFISNDKLMAQDQQGRLGIGGYISAVKMVFGRVDHSTIDQWGGISFSYGFSEKLNLKVDGAYGWVYPKDPDGSQFQSTSSFKTLLYPASVSLDWHPQTTQRFRPFLTFGLGVLMWDIRDVKGADSVWDTGTSLTGRKTDVSILGGAGIQQYITNGINASLFFRLHYLLKGNEDTIGTGDDNRAVAELGLGLSFSSNPNRDMDGDGIFDRWDLCPEVMEDYDGYKDLDGCPDLDNDEDLIVDKEDACPDFAEDFDEYQDDDGCPDLDNDGDGKSDLVDKCPNLVEDLDNFEDDDGCPDVDNDRDGIDDENDKCLNEPETQNGFEDDDGCPDEKPATLELKKETPIILKGLNFESGSARLSKTSFAVLDTVFQTLNAHPEIEVEIRGFTDSSGDWGANLKLSQSRSDAVKQHLVNLGVEAKRMLSIGYGESNPIAANTTPAGRAANRRIEFYRTK